MVSSQLISELLTLDMKFKEKKRWGFRWFKVDWKLNEEEREMIHRSCQNLLLADTKNNIFFRGEISFEFTFHEIVLP